jgi:YfiH family protein
MVGAVDISLRYSSSDLWAPIPIDDTGVFHAGLSLAAAGDMGLNAPGSAGRRDAFLRSLGWRGSDAYAVRQVHSRKIAPVDAMSPAECAVLEADGMACAAVDKLLTVTVADCLPLFVADRRSGTYTLVHSGWKGTGIVRAAVNLMKTEYGSAGRDLRAVIGPGIGACCYRVSRERWEEFRGEFGPAAVCGARVGEDDDYRLDLRRANVELLRGEGVSDIAVVVDCTACSPALGSFRRQGPQAFTRMLAFMWGGSL